MTDSETIENLRTGDEQSYKMLVEDFGNKVFNTVLGLIQNHQDAEDITQEVFIEVFKSVNKFRCDSSLSTWIYRIAINKSLETIRKNKRKKRFAFLHSFSDLKKEAEGVTDFVHPGVLLENKERSAVLFKAISKLPENQKITYNLSKVDGLSNKEIAEIMKMSIQSVESLLHRAKVNLKKYLTNYYTGKL
ncbi:MAG: sigma-70 family RNA polymerase sigma factor [Ignavibacteria bacterium]|nr:sigma-70 family RNA polymerase sigma factor [Ignavibacteria bacterium]